MFTNYKIEKKQSNPGRDIVNTRENQTEISAISRTSLGIGPNDASQCYNRLIPNQALLSCMSHGMPYHAAQCISTTLYHAKYFLRTAASQSSSYWTHSNTTPIYGTGQGSGISPGVCCITYSDLSDIHTTLSTGATYLRPDCTSSITINNIGFVHDTTTTIADHKLNQSLSATSLLSTLQHNLQQWSNVLTISGGALELNKTSVFLLRWLFHDNGTPFPSDLTDRFIKLT